MIENLVFGRFGLNSRVFEKLFISYSCILFIQHCVLSFCIKILCFSKKLIFPDFRSIELVAQLIKIAIKKLGLNLSSLITARLTLDQSNVIFDRLNLIFDRSKIIKRVFKKKLFTCSSLFQTFQKAFLSLSLSSIDPDSSPFFVIFHPNFSQGFFLLVPV